MLLWEALTLQLGYNTTLVTIGVALLGIAAGTVGTFLFLSRHSLVSDAISHATLPGIALAFLIMVTFGGDGRVLWVLLLGSAISAGVGLLVVNWLSYSTRLSPDAAIGAVLSVFFGFGVTLLTIIQTMNTGQQAGLESFLLGSTSGMLWNEAVLIAVGGFLTILAAWFLRRPMILVAFDPEFAAGMGINIRQVEFIMMVLALAVTVFGLKIVGLVLIVALLIIPPVTARLWSNHAPHVVLLSAFTGGLSAYIGAALSAITPNLPTGPIIVLVAFAAFVISLLIAPNRGLVVSLLRHRQFQKRVHLRQGLLALAQEQPIYERLTLRLLRRAGLIHPDGVPTKAGRAQAARALLDEERWRLLRSDLRDTTAAAHYDGLTSIDAVLTPDQLAALDARLHPERVI